MPAVIIDNEVGSLASVDMVRYVRRGKSSVFEALLVESGVVGQRLSMENSGGSYESSKMSPIRGLATLLRYPWPVKRREGNIMR